MAQFHSIGLLWLRVAAGGLMLTHGWPKLAGFSEYATQFPGLFGLPPTLALALAVFAEFFCAILIILGIATRLATIPLTITMLVAALIVHAADPFMKQEFPLLYAVIFIGLFFLGSGKYSLGSKFFKNHWLH